MTSDQRVPRVGVACIVVRDGRVLLIRRQRSHGAGSWSTPGGHLDYGETPAACAMRETEEETGVQVSRVEFLAITNDLFTDAGKHYITVWMLALADSGTASIQDSSEVGEVGWFAPGELPAPLFLSLQNLLHGDGLPPRASNFPFAPHRA